MTPLILKRTARFLALAGLCGFAAFGPVPIARGQAAPAPAIAPAEYAARRQALRQAIRGDGETPEKGPARLALLRGVDVGDRQDYEEGRFYQEANFSYLTGVNLPGAFVLIDANGDRDTLYLPARRLTGSDQAASLGFEEVAATDRLLGDLFTRLATAPRAGRSRARGARLLLLDPNPAETANSAEARFVRWLRAGAAGVEFAELGSLVGELRKPKSEAEVAILQRAIDITGDAQKAAAQVLRPGVHEYTLEGAITNAFLAGGAMRPGFA